MSIADNIKRLKNETDTIKVQLIAVSKTKPEEEIMEAVWVAAEMRAGAAIAHSALAIDVMKEHAPSE